MARRRGVKPLPTVAPYLSIGTILSSSILRLMPIDSALRLSVSPPPHMHSVHSIVPLGACRWHGMGELRAAHSGQAQGTVPTDDCLCDRK
jgi:hypothetical protein